MPRQHISIPPSTIAVIEAQQRLAADNFNRTRDEKWESKADAYREVLKLIDRDGIRMTKPK